MLVSASLEKVVGGERGILVGIDACMQAKCVMSTVTLIYSAIDAMAALTRKVTKKESSSKDFRSWVNKYYLPSLGGVVRDEDLWGARCGVVHTSSPESRSSRKKIAQVVIYKWRHGHRPDDPVLEKRSKGGKILEIEAMVDALRNAVDRFHEDVESDPDLRRRVQFHIKPLLCYEPWQPVTITVAA